jgi:hypothetical protein
VIRGPVGQKDREVLALFETGERLEAPPAPVPALVLEKVTPGWEAPTWGCETGSGDARFEDGSEGVRHLGKQSYFAKLRVSSAGRQAWPNPTRL